MSLTFVGREAISCLAILRSAHFVSGVVMVSKAVMVSGAVMVFTKPLQNPGSDYTEVLHTTCVGARQDVTHPIF
ncbi:MAG: hypothetical protein ACRCYY_17670 [Trueperaceae bacterium]